MSKSLKKKIKAWCRAQVAWSEDCKDGGYPKTVTRADLYYAGRELFEIAGVDPHPDSVYAENLSVERETPKCLKTNSLH
jgi:hypothetical protein